MNTVPHDERLVTLGIDTHADIHVAVALDHLGGRLGAIEIPTTRAGFGQLLEWASEFGVIDRVGIEGTGSYGAGLFRWLRARGITVIEVDRPDRKLRRQRGKDDITDAEGAARSVLSGQATGIPKSADGNVEMIRVLRVARRSAMRAKIATINQLHALGEAFAALRAPRRSGMRAALGPGTTLRALVAGPSAAALRTLASVVIAA